MSIDEMRKSFADPFACPAIVETIYAILSDIFHPIVPFTPPTHDTLGEPETGATDVKTILSVVHNLIVRHSINTRHSDCLAHMVPPPATISVLADLIIGAMNQCAFIWEQAPFAYSLEKEVIEWLNQQIGYTTEAGGLLTSGGTMSNITATYLALSHWRDNNLQSGSLCIITTDQGHVSVDKAAALSGLSRESVIRIESDCEGRVRKGEFRATMIEARRQGKQPFMLVCTAGTTNAGTLEPIEEAISAAHEQGSWCHIDAAHGGAMCLGCDVNSAVKQWRYADSISWDAHKTLYASYAVGSLLVRQKNLLEPLIFNAEYALKINAHHDAGLGHLDGSRRLEALKLWMIIRHLGTNGLTELTQYCCALARDFAHRIRSSKCLRLLTFPDTNIVCFRVEHPRYSMSVTNCINTALQQRLFFSGGPLLSTTSFKARVFQRAVFLNPLTSEADVERIFRTVQEAAETLLDSEQYANVLEASYEGVSSN